ATAIPCQVDAYANLPGTIWFDSALAEVGGVSLLCVHPLFLVRGKLPDVQDLECALAEGKAKFPLGGMAGFFDYEGNYQFYWYEIIYRWDTARCVWLRGEPLVGYNGKSQLFSESCVNSDRMIQDCSLEGGYSLRLRPIVGREKFLQSVGAIKDYIAAGDIYQACLTYDWAGVFEGNSWELYKRMRQLSPAPYGAYMNFEGFQVLSASPEMFLKIAGDSIWTRPIKGTRKRGLKPDAELARELLTSEKERAELTMITDLERNDLGKVCRYGTVRVEELFRVERYSHVLHLVSTVSGRLRDSCTHPQALAACFPGGSITGAPKIRAMEILEELEGRPRGIYTGAIGYFGFDGISVFNIAIRTFVVKEGFASYGTGAGIVADSVPEQEWEETLAKARVVELLGCGESCLALRKKERGNF
ncbi:MAG: aminodeoxychorismate synthase component I, partial [Chthoniobacterales bacterium]|nr:aminodeoxychorismate synthase component I [Chthoniobacterales bacterium]